MLRDMPLPGILLVQAGELYLVIGFLAEKGLLCTLIGLERNFVDLLHLWQLVQILPILEATNLLRLEFLLWHQLEELSLRLLCLHTLLMTQRFIVLFVWFAARYEGLDNIVAAVRTLCRLHQEWCWLFRRRLRYVFAVVASFIHISRRIQIVAHLLNDLAWHFATFI